MAKSKVVRKNKTRKHTGANRQEPLLTRKEFETKKEFSLAEVAGLFNRTVVRVWQLVNEQFVKFKAQEGEVRRTKIRIPKSQIKVLLNTLRNAELHYA